MHQLHRAQHRNHRDKQCKAKIQHRRKAKIQHRNQQSEGRPGRRKAKIQYRNKKRIQPSTGTSRVEARMPHDEVRWGNPQP